MATNSRISFERPDGTVRSIYCHWDGYPEGVGAALQANFNTYEDATGAYVQLKDAVLETA